MKPMVHCFILVLVKVPFVMCMNNACKHGFLIRIQKCVKSVNANINLLLVCNNYYYYVRFIFFNCFVVYKSGTPNVLSFSDLFFGIFQMMTKWVKKLIRIFLIILCWAVVVPFSTSRLYYLFLNKSVPLFSISQFLLDLSIGSIATTCLMGGLVSLVFLAGM